MFLSQNILNWTNLGIRKRIICETSPLLDKISQLRNSSSLKLSHTYICYHRLQKWTHGNSVNLDINLVVKWEVYVFSAQSQEFLHFRLCRYCRNFIVFKNLFYNYVKVYSSGTEVKRNFTSNDTMLQFREKFSFLILTIGSFMLFT